ncbi:MAG: copper transporter, partial [Micromonosporaceae bacterium]
AGEAIISGFAGGGFLSASAKPAQRATLAVVITPADPLTGPAAGASNQTLIAVAAALSEGNLATVMAGPSNSTEPGGAIAALRGSGSGSKVSSVDGADTSFGQIVVVQALAEQMMTHKPGSYGIIGSGATRAGPSPMPTASMTPVAGAPSQASAKHTKAQGR